MIPKSFFVGGRKYLVKFVDSCEDDLDNSYGQFSMDKHEITLARTYKDKKEVKYLSEDDLLETFLHELGHCFGAYYKDDYSEEFACAFSHFMFEYFKSLEK